MDEIKQQEGVEYFSTFGQPKVMGYLLNMVQEAKVYIPTHGAGYITYVQDRIINLVLTTAS
jgi:hypothetical protein